MISPANGQIVLSAVSKAYGSSIVLESVSLTVPKGEILVFVGRSGSGKSTLLRLIGGLESPDSGSVTHDGREISLMSESELSKFRRQSLGFVFQFFNLIPTLNVSENVSLPLALNNERRADAERKVAGLLEELGLEQCAERFPDELSGGEQQRAAIARALIHEPALVIADEPTGNLDLETASQVLQILDHSCRKRKTTLIMATHSDEVIGLADRILRVNNHGVEPSAR